MVLIIIYSCERDDFCLSNPVTPNLVIRLHDVDDEDDTKQIDSLTIWAEGNDVLYSNTTTDSIVLPLNTLTTNTVYNLLHLEDGEEILETFTISYTPEEEYVSRSCGFRIIFNETSLNRDTEGNENVWISSFTPDTITTINNQGSAHVKIFH